MASKNVIEFTLRSMTYELLDLCRDLDVDFVSMSVNAQRPEFLSFGAWRNDVLVSTWSQLLEHDHDGDGS